MKDDISDKWSMSLEFLVGIMLVYLGITSLSFHLERINNICSYFIEEHYSKT